jgi:hypothetical protein
MLHWKRYTHDTTFFFLQLILIWDFHMLISNKLFHKVIIIVIISSNSKWCSKWYGCFQDNKGPRNINFDCEYFFSWWIFYSTYICFVKGFIVHVVISPWNKLLMCIGWLIWIFKLIYLILTSIFIFKFW